MTQKRRATTKVEKDQSKYRKLNEDQDAVNVSETTKIIDINMDCLEQIFKRLSIDDLLKVADSCKRLREAATFTFAIKNKRPKLNLKHIRMSKQFKAIGNFFNVFTISNITTCLRFIRCFGHTLHELRVDYKGANDNHLTTIDHYINEYCAETLQVMKMFNARSKTMSEIQKPFSNVFCLQFSDCDLAQPLLNLKKWFPSVFWLIFDGSNRIAAHKFAAKEFPELSTFEVELKKEQQRQKQRNHFKSYVVNMLRLNTQSYLRLHTSGDGWNARLLQSISKYLQNVYDLEIYWTSDFSNLNERVESLRTIHLKSVRHLSIYLNNFENQSDMSRIPFTFGRLQSITIESMCCKLNDEFLEFIGKQPFLTKFWINTEKSGVLNVIDDKMKLLQILLNFHEIKLPYIFSGDEVKQFLNQCKLLRKFQFKLAKTENFDRFKETWTEEWKISTDFYFGCIEMERL